ncbi:MAG: hypothetical protein R2747_20245 [Pyrinomonadaceae bacterium]
MRKPFWLIIFSLLFLFPVNAQKPADWKISDYLKNLPTEFKTFSGDFASEPNEKTTVIDDRNGYAVYLSSEAKDAFPILEMALFKDARGQHLLVVSNLQSDPVCNFYQTFFLRRDGEKWLEVRDQVLPDLKLTMFFREAKTALEFEKDYKRAGNSDPLDLHFYPPRKGTVLKVALEFCDYVPDDLSGEIDLQKFTDQRKTVALGWDKGKGVFKISR